MRVGIVCPYSWDVPGGVQFHVRDLSEHLLKLGHEVSVLAPADDDDALPPYVVPAGRAVPVPYNGSVARLAFGPLSNARVRRWLDAGGFDVVHIHEPATPSVSLLALWAVDGPVVATFHTSNLRSRAMAAAYPVLHPALEKISARIAVSEDARRTLVEHLGGDAVLIPNGVYVDRFAAAAPRAAWRGEGGTLGFIGRIGESRKGLPVLLAALERVVADRPGVRLLVAGSGDADEAFEDVSPAVRRAVTYLGTVSEEDKRALLATVDAYVAPNLGGESFGIILVEAMAAGAPVVASSLGAFRRVLDDGRVGVLVPVGDAEALAGALLDLLGDETRRAELRAAAARWVRRYDWSAVAEDVLAVYETVAGPPVAAAAPPTVPAWRRGWVPAQPGPPVRDADPGAGPAGQDVDGRPAADGADAAGGADGVDEAEGVDEAGAAAGAHLADAADGARGDLSRRLRRAGLHTRRPGEGGRAGAATPERGRRLGSRWRRRLR